MLALCLELKTTKQFDKMKDILIKEIKCININFQFWQKQNFSTWQYISLTGNNKLKMLKMFNLVIIFAPKYLILIRQL
ncbi:13460_t:CDS:2 [Cetraspora pellucida]|uniref:13460_t:CDS:1 n=1 Tax=Cetraspora pellucida TaxID=1433469 RepID=A0A9N9HMT6_9GLOM|nr:13460_t:CDS:2 [Cetraspora pellucida]